MDFWDFNLDQKGFTLTEVIVVVIIVGVLAAIAIPNYQYVIEKVRAAEGTQILISLLGAQKQYELEEGVFADDYADLDVEIPNPSNFDAIGNANINTADPLATVARTAGAAPGGDYILTIDEDGTIKCTGAATSCSKLGCNKGAANNECN